MYKISVFGKSNHINNLRMLIRNIPVSLSIVDVDRVDVRANSRVIVSNINTHLIMLESSHETKDILENISPYLSQRNNILYSARKLSVDIANSIIEENSYYTHNLIRIGNVGKFYGDFPLPIYMKHRVSKNVVDIIFQNILYKKIIENEDDFEKVI